MDQSRQKIPTEIPGGPATMAESEPKRIKVVIYPNQLEWMDRIGTVLNQTRRETFLDCFAQFIGTFKEETGLGRKNHE